MNSASIPAIRARPSRDSRLVRVTALAACAAVSSIASASITSTSGQMLQIPPPPSVALNAYITTNNIVVFNEKQNVAFSGSVDVLSPIIGPWYHPLTSVGTMNGIVSSHLVHAQPIYTGPTAVNRTGRVTFANPIVAIIFSNTRLDATDASLGLGSVAYPFGVPNRGMNAAFVGQDRCRLINAFTIEFTLGASIDQARVLTTPTPGAFAVAAMGASIWGVRRRREAQA